jgi:hypothetical protein
MKKYLPIAIAFLILIYLPVHFVYALNGDTPFLLLPLHIVATALSLTYALDYESRQINSK